ncbi:MAG: methyltransferase domain-containing protein [Armatimonadetes bacterium]|nr:methyltransferase domain-containing protein [Armatimonadota bacterium]
MNGEPDSRWDPVDYQRHSSAQLGWARELIAKLRLRGDERVLDVGCGDGRVTAELALQVPRGEVVGIDSSGEMVVYAAATFPPERWPNLSFRVMDARAMTFEAEFDRVFSNAVLHWLVDHRAALAGIARALRPGGWCLLQMGARGNAAGVQAAVDELVREPAWSAHFEGMGEVYGFHGPAEYRAWLAEAGLAPRRVELVAKDMAHDGPDGLAGWFRTTWLPYTHRVPGARREAFIAAVVERYLAGHPVDAEGRTHVGMVRLEVEAESVG